RLVLHIADSPQAVIRTPPKRFVAHLLDQIELVLHQAAGSKLSQVVTFDAEQTRRSAGKNRAVTTLTQREERDVRQMGRLVHALEPSAATDIKPAIGARPDPPLLILQNSSDKFVCQTVLRAEGTKATSLILEQTATIRGDPKRSIAPER